jgi:predicted transcriptional regulator
MATASFGRVGRPRGGRGAKRTSADLEALSDRFASFVKANPGLRIEQINKQLGTTTKDLALPIRKLISEGVISAKGQKRSTTYFAGKKKAKN